MYYYATGEIQLEIDSFYSRVLDTWIIQNDLEEKVMYNHGTLSLKGLFEEPELHDMFLFLNRFSILAHVDITTHRNNKPHFCYELFNEKIYQYAYGFNHEKKGTESFDCLIQSLQKDNFSIDIDLDSWKEEELLLFEQSILTFEHNKIEDFEKAKMDLSLCICLHPSIAFITNSKKWVLHDSSLSSVAYFPYEQTNTPIDITTPSAKISAFTVDTDEMRQIYIHNNWLPLDELFMSKRNEPIVLLPSGEKVTPCSQCFFRLKQTTGGCITCTPKKIKK